MLEVIGRCDGDEKNEWPRRTNKSQTLKNNNIVFNRLRFYLKFDDALTTIS